MSESMEETDIQQVWSEVVDQLASEMSSLNFNKWIASLDLISLVDGVAHLLAPNEFYIAWINSKYRDAICEALSQALGQPCDIVLTEVKPLPVQLTLPTIRPDERMAPNALIRSALFGIIRRGRRRAVEKKLIQSWRGWSIRYTGHQLDQGELDVWLQCIALMHERELGTEVQFRAGGFLKALGRRRGKSQYEQLDMQLTRLKANGIEIQNGQFAYVGALIDKYYRDDESELFIVELNPDLVSLFGTGLTRVQWDERLSLRRQLSKYLHLYIHSHRATPENPHRIGVERLQELCGSDTKHLWKFRQQLRNSMEELSQLGVVTRWKITSGDALEFIRPAPKQVGHTA